MNPSAASSPCLERAEAHEQRIHPPTGLMHSATKRGVLRSQTTELLARLTLMLTTHRNFLECLPQPHHLRFGVARTAMPELERVAEDASRSRRPNSGRSGRASAALDIELLAEFVENGDNHFIHLAVGKGPVLTSETETPGDAAGSFCDAFTLVEIEGPNALQQIAGGFANDCANLIGGHVSRDQQCKIPLDRG